MPKYQFHGRLGTVATRSSDAARVQLDPFPTRRTEDTLAVAFIKGKQGLFYSYENIFSSDVFLSNCPDP